MFVIIGATERICLVLIPPPRQCAARTNFWLSGFILSCPIPISVPAGVCVHSGWGVGMHSIIGASVCTLRRLAIQNGTLGMSSFVRKDRLGWVQYVPLLDSSAGRYPAR